MSKHLPKKTSKKNKNKRSNVHLGTSPGSLHVDPEAPKPVLNLITYGPNHLEDRRLKHVRDLPSPDPQGVVWLNICGFGDLPTLQSLGAELNLHPLALEDVVHADQRAKVDTYGDWTFIVACMVESSPATVPVFEQISIFVQPGIVITFQELPEDCFTPIRKRLQIASSRLRSRGADYLAYALVDLLIDGYFPILDLYGDRLEALEDRILCDASEANLEALHRQRRELILLRKTIAPHREAINALMRSNVQPFTEETQLFLRDCYDHTIRIIEMVETYREFATSLMDVYLSTLGQKTNDVMKVLTIISTIFIPLSFLAGLYGMNFDTSHPLNMPELGSPFGYFGLLSVMAGIVVALVFYFHRKGWF